MAIAIANLVGKALKILVKLDTADSLLIGYRWRCGSLGSSSALHLCCADRHEGGRCRVSPPEPLITFSPGGRVITI